MYNEELLAKIIGKFIEEIDPEKYKITNIRELSREEKEEIMQMKIAWSSSDFPRGLDVDFTNDLIINYSIERTDSRKPYILMPSGQKIYAGRGNGYLVIRDSERYTLSSEWFQGDDDSDDEGQPGFIVHRAVDSLELEMWYRKYLKESKK